MAEPGDPIVGATTAATISGWDEFVRERIAANVASKAPLQTLDDMAGRFRLADPTERAVLAAHLRTVAASGEPDARRYAAAFLHQLEEDGGGAQG